MSPSNTKPHAIERLAVDSSNIKSIGRSGETTTVEFINGHIYAYTMSDEAFEAFATSSSKGRWFNQQIRGKFEGKKLTSICHECGSEPEIIGETCASCGCATIREQDRIHKEAQ